MSALGVVLRRPWRVIYLNILLVIDIVLSSCEPVVRTATVVPTPEVIITVNLKR